VSPARRRLVTLAVATASALVACACGHSTGNAQPAQPQQARVPGQYLVTLASPADVKAIADAYGRFGVKAMRDLGNSLFLVTLAEDPGPAEIEKLGRGNARIKAVQPNYVYRARGSSTAR
jgi:hypothetical protein